MGRVKRQLPGGGILFGYRRERGGPEVYWKAKSLEDCRSFETLIKASRQAGTRVPDPVELFGETDRTTARERGSEITADAALDDAEATGPTLAAMVGTSDALGDFFDVRTGSARSVVDLYLRSVYDHAADIANVPMESIGRRDALRFRNRLLICPACFARAEAAGRHELVARAESTLLATNPRAWDGTCPDHYPRFKRKTIIGYIVALGAIFNTAIEFTGECGTRWGTRACADQGEPLQERRRNALRRTEEQQLLSVRSQLRRARTT